MRCGDGLGKQQTTNKQKQSSREIFHLKEFGIELMHALSVAVKES